MNDGTGDSNTATVSVSITAVNDAPTATPGTLAVEEDQKKSGFLIGQDVDTVTTLFFSVVTQGNKGAVTIDNPTTGAFSYVPNLNATDVDTFYFKVNDGELDSNVALMTVYIQAEDDPPTISAIADQTVSEDGTTTPMIAFTVSDPDTAVGSLTLSAQSSVTSLVKTSNILFYGNDANRALEITPMADQYGDAIITVTVSDSVSSVNRHFTLTVIGVNDVPTVTGKTVEINEDTNISGVLDAYDKDGDSLTYSIVQNPTSGSVTLDNASTGAFTYQSAPNTTGLYSFTFKVNDGTADSGNVATVTILIGKDNDRPLISAIADQTIDEDSSTSNLSFTISDQETTESNLELSVFSSNTTLVPTENIVLAITEGVHSVTATPVANKFGTAVITIKVSDGLLDAESTFTLTVNSVNDTPEIRGIPGTIAIPGSSWEFTPVALDVDGDTLTFSVQNLPSWVMFDVNSGRFYGIPTDGDYGTYYNIMVSVTDNQETALLASFNLTVVDMAAPTMENVVDGVFKASQTVILACSDAGSGCDVVYYTLDGSEPTANSLQYSTPITVDSSIDLRFVAADYAGNLGMIHNKTFTMDMDPPEVFIDVPLDGSPVNQLFEIEGRASDVGTGVAKVELQITDGTYYLKELSNKIRVFTRTPSWVEAITEDAWANWIYYTNINWTTETTYSITARVVDVAKNDDEDSIIFAYSLDGGEAFTQISMELSSKTILQNKTIDITGKLSRLPETAMSLAGRTIKLRIKTPNNVIEEKETETYNQYGHFVFNEVNVFNLKGTYELQVLSEKTTLLSGSVATDAVLVGTSAGYAIIVQGKIANEEGLLSHNKTANRVYKTMKKRGFSDDNIKLFNYDMQQSDIQVDDVPSKSAIQDSIENWAKERMNSVPAPLYLVMVDHGNVEKFMLDDRFITPVELDQWFDTLESGLNSYAIKEPRITVMGACYSGSFIPALSASGRMIVTSAASNEESFKGPKEPDNIRVGEYFLEAFFKEWGKGVSLSEAFKKSTNRTEIFTRRGGLSSNSEANRFLDQAMQHPLLDDNGDAIGSNNLTDASKDGQLASTLFLGTGVSYNTNSVDNPAELTDVTETLYLNFDQTNAQLWAKANDNSQVTSAVTTP